MTLIVWRVLFVASTVLFLTGIIVLFCAKFLKNQFYHVFTDDELVSKNKLSNGKNSVYFTSGETKEFIDRYAMCKTEFDRYLVCKFVKKFDYIRYFVLEYTSGGKVVKVQQIDEFDTALNSKIITLHRRCARVNVIVGTVEENPINTDVIRPLSRRKIRLCALVKSFTLFAFLFSMRHVVLEFLFRGAVSLYLADTLNYIAVAAAFGIGLLSYIITVLCLRGKNIKALNGGAVEYEFV